MEKTRIKEILSRIERGEISPEEGRNLIHQDIETGSAENLRQNIKEEVRDAVTDQKKSIFRALQLNGICQMNHIKLRNVSPLKPKPGQVIVAVKATALNFMDLIFFP